MKRRPNTWASTTLSGRVIIHLQIDNPPELCYCPRSKGTIFRCRKRDADRCHDWDAAWTQAIQNRTFFRRTVLQISGEMTNRILGEKATVHIAPTNRCCWLHSRSCYFVLKAITWRTE
jgi:hypothetical protein